MSKYPKIIFAGDPKPHGWCRWAVNRVKHQNNSTNIRFIGDTGSGKSWSALAIAEIMAGMMNKQIEAEDIYFSISDVIRRIAKSPPKAGTIFFIDEQQVQGSAGEHSNLRGKAYTTFFSTVRSRRYIIISTMPFADMIIKKVRRFFHVEIETIGVDVVHKVVKTKPRLLEYHKQKDYVYRKRLVVISKDPKSGITKGKKISTWDIPKPSDEMINIYEQKKAEFQQATYTALVKDLDKYEDKHLESEEDVKTKNIQVIDSLTDYQKDIYEVYCEFPGLNQSQVSDKLAEKGHNSSPGKVSGNLRWMKSKGVIILKKHGKHNKMNNVNLG